MEGLEIVIAATAGINAITLGAVLINNYRVGKIEGILGNGVFKNCPFYKGHITEAVEDSSNKE